MCWRTPLSWAGELEDEGSRGPGVQGSRGPGVPNSQRWMGKGAPLRLHELLVAVVRGEIESCQLWFASARSRI